MAKDLIGWIRQNLSQLSKLSRHRSYHKVKRMNHSVNLNAEVRKSAIKGDWPIRIAAHDNLKRNHFSFVLKSAQKLNLKVKILYNSPTSSQKWCCSLAVVLWDDVTNEQTQKIDSQSKSGEKQMSTWQNSTQNPSSNWGAFCHFS